MPYPTVYNPATGQWEEVNEEEAQQEYGIPIGPPTQYSDELHEPPSGGLEMPGNEPPDYYNPGARESFASAGRPQLFASTEPGVPGGYQGGETEYDPDKVMLDETNPPVEQPHPDVPVEHQIAQTGVYNNGLPPGWGPIEGSTQPQAQAQPQAPVSPQKNLGLPSGWGQVERDNQPVLDPTSKEYFPPTYDITYYGDIYPKVAEMRQRLVHEIDSNPALFDYLAATVSQEAGSPDAIQAVVEALFNRAHQRGTTIVKELTNGFYGPVNIGQVDRVLAANGGKPAKWMVDQFNTALDAVRNGSDLIDMRTDQGGFGEIDGPKIRVGKGSGADYFGYMGGDPTWSLSMLKERGSPGPAYYAKGKVPGLIEIPEQQNQAQRMGLPAGWGPVNQGQAATQGVGLDAAIAEAKDAGLTVTSGYRGPNDPLTKANPNSPHAQGRAFDLRAKTGAEADEVMAKQRDVFAKRGLQEGRDYRFIDEVRHPSGHATGPHVHVEMTEGGLGYYSEGAGQPAQPANQGLPSGFGPVEKAPEQAGAEPVEPAVTSQQLPSGEMAPLRAGPTETIRQAIPVNPFEGILPLDRSGLTPNIARYMPKPEVPPEPYATPQETEDQLGINAQRIDLPGPYENYNTTLSDEEEAKYQKWKAENAPKDSGEDYDLRGAYKAGLVPDPETGHWPDTFKKPNHPTFSIESQYAVGPNRDKAGHWEGDKFVPTRMFGYTERKELKPDEDKFLKENPQVAGFAADDGRVVMNPYSPPGVNKQAVKENEAFRLKMAEFGDTVPDFELTDKQKAQFKGTAYENEPDRQKQTIAARIYSGDPTAMDATEKQKKWVADFSKFERRKVGAGEAFSMDLTGRAAGISANAMRMVRWLGNDPTMTPEENKASNKNFDATMQWLLNLRESVKEKPKEEERGAGARTAGTGGSLAADVLASFLLPFQGKGGILKKMGATALSFAPASVSNAIDAWDEAQKQGLSKKESGAVAIATLLESAGMTAIPLNLGSKAENIVARMAIRFTKGTLAGIGLAEVSRVAHNVYASYKGRPQTPFDLQRDIEGAIPLGILSAIGGHGRPPAKYDGPRAIDILNAPPDVKTFRQQMALFGQEGRLREQISAAEQQKGLADIKLRDKLGREIDNGNSLLSKIDSQIEGITKKDTISESDAHKLVDLYEQAFKVAKNLDGLKEQVTKYLPPGEKLEPPPAPTTPTEGGPKIPVPSGPTAPPPPERKGEPIEPVHEEVTKPGRKVTENTSGKTGEVVGQKKGMLDIEWDDGTKGSVAPSEVTRAEVTTTKPKNSVLLLPEAGKQASVHYYDAEGKRTSTKPLPIEDATAKAQKITADKNLSGYHDIEGNFVRERGTPGPTEIERPVPPTPVVTTHGPEGTTEVTTEAPGMTPEMLARLEASKAGMHRRLRKAVPGITPEGLANADNKYAYAFQKLMGLKSSAVAKLFMDTKVGDKTVAQWLQESLHSYMGPSGASYKFSRSYDSPAAMELDRDTGALVMRINPDNLLAEMIAARELKGEQAHVDQFMHALSEELIHGAHFTMERARYDALSPGEKAYFDALGEYEQIRTGIEHTGYDAWFALKIKSAIGATRAIADGLPKSDGDEIRRILANSINVYRSSPRAEAPRAAGPMPVFRKGDVFDFMLEEAHRGKPEYIWMEFMRQAIQSHTRGKLSEDGLALITSNTHDYYRGMLDHLHKSFGDMFSQNPSLATSALGHMIKEDIAGITAVLNDASAKRALAHYSSIQSIPATSAKTTAVAAAAPSYRVAKAGVAADPFLAFMGNTRENLKADGTYTPVYRVHGGITEQFPRQKGFGTHVGTPKAAFDRFTQATRGTRGFNKPWATYPLYMRMENPVIVKDQGAFWVPAEVASDLRNRNYITDAEISDLIARDGSITDHGLVNLLQSKRYDGMKYVNTFEGLRMLTPEEVQNKLDTASYTPTAGKFMGMGPGRDFVVTDSLGQTIGRGETKEAAYADAKQLLESKPQPIDHSYIVFEGNQLKSAYANEGTYSPHNPRIIKKKGVEVQSLEDQIVAEHKKSGGSSISQAYGNVNGKDYYLIGAYPELSRPVDGPEILHKDLYEVRDRALQQGLDLNREDILIGTWYDRESNKSVIDVSAIVPDFRRALEIGRSYGQKAIWDAAIQGEVYINGAMGGELPAISERMGFIAKKGAEIREVTDPRERTDISKLPELKITDIEVEQRGRAQKDWREWYDNWNRFSLELHRDVDPGYRPLLDEVMAATSTKNLVGSNWTQGFNAIKNFILYGDLGRGQEGFKARYNNLRRIMRGEGIQGGKVPEYSPALMGDPYASAVDLHVGRTLFQTHLLEGKAKDKLSDRQRWAGQLAIMRVADRMGWKWSELQAALFQDDLARLGQPNRGYEYYAPKFREEYLKLIEADARKGGQLASLGKAVLARASTRIGPEALLRGEAGDVARLRARIRAERAAAIDPEFAQSISLTGPKEDVPSLYGPTGEPLAREPLGKKGAEPPPREPKAGDSYWMDPMGKLHFVRDPYSGIHDEFATHNSWMMQNRGMGITGAAKEGWLRVVTTSKDIGHTVYWEGNQASFLQLRALKDLAADLGFDIEREGFGTIAAYENKEGIRRIRKAGAAGAGTGTGRTATGTPTTEFERRVESAFKRNLLFDGAKHVLWHSPGMSVGGDALHKHTDLTKKLMADSIKPFYNWELKMGLRKKVTGEKRRVIQEHEAWQAARAAGLPLPALSPAAKLLKDAHDEFFAMVNLRNARNNITVLHPDTGKYVPIPHVDFPAQIKESVMKAMRQGDVNVREWRDLRDGFIADKILPATATDADVQSHINKILTNHDKNGAFGRFFFFPNTMPKNAFDYTFRSVHEFARAWVDRTAQIEAFGPTREKDVFQWLIDHTHDPTSKEYLKEIQGFAYGDIINGVYGRAATSMGQVAGIVHLANPYSATKNFVSGQAFNAQSLGLIRYTKAVFQVAAFGAIKDGVELGVLTRDLMNSMAYGDQISRGMQAVGGVAFKYSLWNAAENLNRGVAMVGHRSMLRDMVNEYRTKGRTDKVLRYMGFLQRLGFRGDRAEALLRENGKGDLTDEYIRAGVNEIQGGYTYADVPVFMSSPTGKALFKYQKWNAEQSRHFMREVAQAAARGARVAPPETIELTNPKTGNKEVVTIPRSVSEMMPLARYLFILPLAAAGMAWSLEKMFGIKAKVVTMAEALAQYKKGGPEKFNKFIDMIWQYHRMVGSLGAIGQYIQSGLVWAGIEEGRKGEGKITDFGLSETVPALDPFMRVADAIQNAIDTGSISPDVLARQADQLADSMSFYRTNKQFILHQMDVFGFANRYSTVLANKQDVAQVKYFQRRYARDIGYELPKGPTVPAEKTELSAWREPLDEAISAGDLARAKAIIDRAKAGMGQARWQIELPKLKAHIKSKAPLDPLAHGEVAVPGFYKWSKSNLSPYNQALIKRVDETYKHTAQRLNLGIAFPYPSPEDVGKFMYELKVKQQPTNY